MAEYIGIKERRYFASVRENLPTRWKGNSSNPLFRFPDMREMSFRKLFSGAQFSFNFDVNLWKVSLLSIVGYATTPRNSPFLFF